MHPHSSPTRWNRLGCLRGISALTGLALTVEMGDWSRFTGSAIGAYVGLVLCEDLFRKLPTISPLLTLTM